MKSSAFKTMCGFGAVMFFAPLAHAATTQYTGKNISVLETVPTDDCVYFQLEGVTEANPVVPNGVWFGVSLSQPSGKALYAQLLAARLSSVPLGRVLANGSQVCGVAAAYFVDF